MRHSVAAALAGRRRQTSLVGADAGVSGRALNMRVPPSPPSLAERNVAVQAASAAVLKRSHNEPTRLCRWDAREAGHCLRELAHDVADWPGAIAEHDTRQMMLGQHVGADGARSIKAGERAFAQWRAAGAVGVRIVMIGLPIALTVHVHLLFDVDRGWRQPAGLGAMSRQLRRDGVRRREQRAVQLPLRREVVLAKSSALDVGGLGRVGEGHRQSGDVGHGLEGCWSDSFPVPSG